MIYIVNTLMCTRIGNLMQYAIKIWVYIPCPEKNFWKQDFFALKLAKVSKNFMYFSGKKNMCFFLKSKAYFETLIFLLQL